MKNKIIKFFKKFFSFVELKIFKISQRKKMKNKKRMAIAKKTRLTKEQKAQIQNFYKKEYGKKISTTWHRYYQTISGKFCVEYVPETVYGYFEKTFNNRNIGKALENKIIQYQVFSKAGVCDVPKIYCFSKNGKWFDGSFKELTLEEVVLLFQTNKMFGKPYFDTNSGVGCKIFDYTCDQQDSIKKEIKRYEKNYLFEEIVETEESVSALHPQSVNTFRIMTYLLNNEVFVCNGLMRIGRGGNNVDNAHAGGIFIGVKTDGKLNEFAVTEFGERVYKHPDSNIVFAKHKINSYDKILDTAKSLHLLLQDIRVASWDLTLNKDGEVTFIEINPLSQSPWLVQMASGESVFGENTAQILNELNKSKKNYKI